MLGQEEVKVHMYDVMGPGLDTLNISYMTWVHPVVFAQMLIQLERSELDVLLIFVNNDIDEQVASGYTRTELVFEKYVLKNSC